MKKKILSITSGIMLFISPVCQRLYASWHRTDYALIRGNRTDVFFYIQ